MITATLRSMTFPSMLQNREHHGGHATSSRNNNKRSPNGDGAGNGNGNGNNNSNSNSNSTSESKRRARRSGPRIHLACINCKDRKLKCDEQVPACANCSKYGFACLVEDPTTKRHQPRNYLETLEDRVAVLENLLQHAYPDIASSSLGPHLLNNEESTPLRASPSKTGEDEDRVDDLASKVGMLGLSYAAGAEPQYLGASSAFAFSRIINPSLRLSILPKGNSEFCHAQESTPTLHPCLLPDYETGLMLSNAYFENIHPQYPFLHEPTFRKWEARLMGPTEGVDFTFDPVPSFFVNMIYSIGGLLLSNSHSLSKQLYISAQLYIDQIISRDNLEAIQAILCYAMYSLRSPAGPSIWKLSGLALRQCIELGYHRCAERFGGSTADPLQLELRKRTFWCAFGIDCSVATSLGRPLGLPLYEVDIEFPLDIDDACITELGIWGTPRTSHTDSPTTMSIAQHVFQLRCLWARIHTSLYWDIKSVSARPPVQSQIEQLRKELEEWLATAPPILPRTGSALSIFASRDWFELNYNYSIVLLYRGQLTDPKTVGVADSVFMECLHAAESICHGYRRHFIGSTVNYTWGALHFLFLAGLTYLHCLWTSPAVRSTVRQDDVSSTCQDCTIVLVVMAERWVGAGTYRDIFEALASRTMTMMVDKNHELWMLPTPTSPVQSLDPGQFAQWMVDVNDVGMGDIFTGVIGSLGALEQDSNSGNSWGVITRSEG